MKFKVGDKVRLTRELTREDLAEVKINLSADQVIKELGRNVFEVKDISEKNLRILISLPSDNWSLKPEWFELAEPQVGDVWSNEDKSTVVKILSKPKDNDGDVCVTFVYLNGTTKGFPNWYLLSTFLRVFPIILQRPPKPKKQPKVVGKQPKKQEEKWERVFGTDDHFRCGNKIKVLVNGFEGYAECNKNDKFDLMFGINLAAHRAMVKYHQWVIEKMLKEGVK